MDPMTLKNAGFSDEEIAEYSKLQSAGFSPDEIDSYYKGKPATEDGFAKAINFAIEQPHPLFGGVSPKEAVETAKSFPKDVWGILTGTASAIAHPVKTFEGITDVGAGAFSKVLPDIQRRNLS